MDRLALRRLSLAEIPASASRSRDREAERTAAAIIDEVEDEGEAALRRWAERLGELEPGGKLFLDGAALERALSALGREERSLLERSRDRISAFAAAQRACLSDLELPLQGGVAGHRFLPVNRAGCYIPGGLHPLASSALMTVLPARAAGVRSVWCAGPRPAGVTLAAAALAGSRRFLAAGGAQR